MKAKVTVVQQGETMFASAVDTSAEMCKVLVAPLPRPHVSKVAIALVVVWSVPCPLQTSAVSQAGYVIVVYQTAQVGYTAVVDRLDIDTLDLSLPRWPYRRE